MTASESGVLGMPDAELLARSDIDGRVVVSHDGDFLRLHHRQQHAGIVYAEQGTRTNWATGGGPGANLRDIGAK